MTILQQSDLASIINMQARQAQVKSRLDVANQELASGVKLDLVKASGGDLNRLFGVEASLNAFESDRQTLETTSAKAGVMQVALDRIGSSLSGYGPQLMAAVNGADSTSLGIVGRDAKNRLDAVVSSLNIKLGRHHLFSGASVDRRPLTSAASILSDVSAQIMAAPDAATALAAIDSYFFDPAGGFETNIYKGAAQDVGAVQLANGEKIEYGVRADSGALRRALRAFAIAAVASDLPVGPGIPDKMVLLKEAGVSTINAADELVHVREVLGFAEESIQEAKVYNHAQTTAFEIERNGITSVDPYTAAINLKALQGQLQSIYTLTAQLSGLSLTNYLR